MPYFRRIESSIFGYLCGVIWFYGYCH